MTLTPENDVEPAKSCELVNEYAVEVDRGADSTFKSRDWTTWPSGTDTLTFSTAPSGNEPIDIVVGWPIGVAFEGESSEFSSG